MGEQAVPADPQAGPALGEADLLGPVSRLLGEASAVPGSWRVTSLSDRATAPISGGLFRVAGVATAAGGRRPWSLILKIVRPPAGRARDSFPQGWDPGHHCYWRREPLVYGAGILPSAGGAFRAARCFGITARPEERVWLWLEDVGAADGRSWETPRCLLAARHLGAFNGAYLAGCPLPAAAWLNDACLGTVSAPGARLLDQVHDPATWTTVAVTGLLPPGTEGRVRRLLGEREGLLEALARLPRTLCHQDAHRENLFSVSRSPVAASHGPPVGREGPPGAAETVAIDWAQAGTGAPGEDLVQLGYDLTVYSSLVPEPRRFHEAAFDAYVAGLRDAGWNGDARLARLGYTGAAALRAGVGTLTLVLAGLLGPAAGAEGPPAPARGAERRARALTAYLDLGDEALALRRC